MRKSQSSSNHQRETARDATSPSSYINSDCELVRFYYLSSIVLPQIVSQKLLLRKYGRELRSSRYPAFGTLLQGASRKAVMHKTNIVRSSRVGFEWWTSKHQLKNMLRHSITLLSLNSRTRSLYQSKDDSHGANHGNTIRE